MLSLYDATVPGFRQTIGAMRGLLKKGRDFCEGGDLDLEALADTALHPAMKPFRFQIVAGLHFSMGSIAALQTGRIGVPSYPPVRRYDALESMVDAALARLAEVVPAEVEERATAMIVFEAGERKPAFTGAGLLLSFAIPNLHFHATTTYDILRIRGVELGKRDYLGRMTMVDV